MNILNEITNKSLKLNRKRTVSTIIAIMLSVALVCAVATMVSSFYSTMVDYTKSSEGDWHFQMLSKDKGIEDKFKANRMVEKTFEIDTMGYAKLPESKNRSKTNITLVSMNKNAFEQMHFDLKKGRFPKNENELLISRHIITNGGVDYKIGDKVSYKFFKSFFDAENVTEADYPNGGMKKLFLNEIPDEELEKLDNHEFTIVGIMDRPPFSFESYSSSGYTVITSGMEKNFAPYIYGSYCRLTKPSKYKEFTKSFFNIDYEKLYENQAIRTNDMLLRYEGRNISENNLMMIYMLAAVIIFIILLASVFCIRNSFSIAITEKMKQYGFLASVGATKKQIKSSVFYEAFKLASVGIPLGVLLGLVADYIVIQVINNIFSGINMGDEFILSFRPSILAIIVSIILGIVTIVLSAYSSAWKAAKVSPVDSIKGSTEIKLNPKKLKTPGWIKKFFGAGGVIAYKNLVRSRKKYRTTVVSIVVSIVIFVTMTSLIQNLFKYQSIYFTSLPYNMEFEENVVSKEGNVDKILSMGDYDFAAKKYKVKGENGKDVLQLFVNKKGVITDEYKKYSDYVGANDSEKMIVSIVAYDDKTYKFMANQNGLDYNKVKDGAILFNTRRIFDNNDEKYKEYKTFNFETGDSIKFDAKYYDEEEEKFKNDKSGSSEFKLGVVSDMTEPIGYAGSYGGDALIVIDKKTHPEYIYSIDRLYMNASDPDSLEKKVSKMTGTGEDSFEMGIINFEKMKKDSESLILIIYIFAYGFIAVITLIGLTNIFNTITSNVELRQRDFASLKSIGMTKHEFNRMINLETLFYSVKALIIGIFLSLIGDYVIRTIVEKRLISSNVYYPVKPIIISIVAVFVLVYIIMKYSISKINKKNIVETIRKENI